MNACAEVTGEQGARSIDETLRAIFNSLDFSRYGSFKEGTHRLRLIGHYLAAVSESQDNLARVVSHIKQKLAGDPKASDTEMREFNGLDGVVVKYCAQEEDQAEYISCLVNVNPKDNLTLWGYHEQTSAIFGDQEYEVYVALVERKRGENESNCVLGIMIKDNGGYSFSDMISYQGQRLHFANLIDSLRLKVVENLGRHGPLPKKDYHLLTMFNGHSGCISSRLAAYK